MPRAVLTEIAMPEFGVPIEMPERDPGLYRRRFAALMDRAAQAGLDRLVIYADREHAANMAWATGFDPRFEEALLVAGGSGQPLLLTGPENQGPAALSPLDARVALYPPFGLMGQDRSRTPPLAELLGEAGIAARQRIGLCGWKYFSAAEFDDPDNRSEVPSFIVDVLRALSGDPALVVNANALLMSPRDGLRSRCEVEELASFEFAACHTSEAIRRVIAGARPGMREFDVAALMAPIGLPLSCHAMFSSGPRAWHGLLGPTARRLQRGDAVTAAYGVQGALNCRNGWLAEGPEDLDPAIGDYVDRLVAPYFSAVAEWLSTVGIGVRGGDLHGALMKRLGDPFFGVALNPGHLIHLDEWMHSPIFSGSDIALRSGMALQVDVIPATGGPYFTTNMEDGIALLDEPGRAAFAERYPDAWGRIQARRAFMDESLGIRLKPEVLPFSNLASRLPPFWLSPGMAMALR